MLKTVVIASVLLAAGIELASSPVSAQVPSGNPADSVRSDVSTTPPVKQAEPSRPESTPVTSSPTGDTLSIANLIAVCPCGNVFIPNAGTKYLETGGKRYACCEEGCYNMAKLNPAASARMARENFAKLMARLNPAKQK